MGQGCAPCRCPRWAMPSSAPIPTNASASGFGSMGTASSRTSFVSSSARRTGCTNVRCGTTRLLVRKAHRATNAPSAGPSATRCGVSTRARYVFTLASRSAAAAKHAKHAAKHAAKAMAAWQRTRPSGAPGRAASLADGPGPLPPPAPARCPRSREDTARPPAPRPDQPSGRGAEKRCSGCSLLSGAGKDFVWSYVARISEVLTCHAPHRGVFESLHTSFLARSRTVV